MESAAQPTGPPGEPQPVAVPIGESPASAHAAASEDPFAARPELFVGAAFAGGLVLAKILKRLRR
jgi:hypothetical protein